jgi:hypothetical protein
MISKVGLALWQSGGDVGIRVARLAGTNEPRPGPRRETKPIAVRETKPIAVRETKPIAVRETKPIAVREANPMEVWRARVVNAGHDGPGVRSPERTQATA